MIELFTLTFCSMFFVLWFGAFLIQVIRDCNEFRIGLFLAMSCLMAGGVMYSLGKYMKFLAQINQF